MLLEIKELTAGKKNQIKRNYLKTKEKGRKIKIKAVSEKIEQKDEELENRKKI